MQTFRRYLIVGGTAISMLALAGVATATVPPNGPHTNPLLRVYPVCPSRDLRAVSSTTTGSGKTLVPAGARRVLLCRYSGYGTGAKPVGARSFRLLAHHLVTARATVDSLTGYLDALKPVTGVQACPLDNGAAIIAFFGYGSTPKADDPVTIHLGGCSPVTNGHVNREASSSFERQLESLAAAHH